MDTNSEKQNNLEKYGANGMSLKNKMDKIVAALHMVTDCITENEPIRFKLRSLSVELASQSHELIYTPARDRGFIFADIELVSTEIMSFLNIARSVRLISEMNAGILLRELTSNTERMRSWTETGFYEVENSVFATASSPTSFTLNENHFNVESIPSPSLPQRQDLGVGSNSSTEQFHKGHASRPAAQNEKPKPEAQENRKFDFALKLNRRNVILKIIKDKKEVTIKDITTIIGDVSEKTIQRELITLVSEGVLKKVGEKRWSKYMLA